MKISVVIPTLNESACIEECLRKVRAHQPDEIIVADGGSVDATAQIASRYAAVISAPRGRASQMNAAAETATGDVLVFLHADTALPEGGVDSIRKLMHNPSVEAGIFQLSFDRESPFLNFYSAFTKLPIPQLCFGDRALFVRRNTFEEVGGYPNIPIFEDLELARTLGRRGKFCFLQAAVTTSARRFRRYGVIAQQLRNLLLYAGYLLGASPRILASFYDYR